MAEVEHRRANRRELGGAATISLIVIVVLCLGGVIAYLLSDINSRRYRLAAVGAQLVIERGRFLPVGFQRYIPKAEALRAAYAPLPMPEDSKLDRPEQFDDRADLDRALFSLLAGWARKGLGSSDPTALKRAANYIERCNLLPGLSEQQRVDLKSLRADLAYRAGRTMLNKVAELLNEAVVEFKLSKELGTSRPTDADRWIAEIERRISAYSLAPPAPEETPGHELAPHPTAPHPLGRPPGIKDSTTPRAEPGQFDRPLPEAQESPKPTGEKWRL